MNQIYIEFMKNNKSLISFLLRLYNWGFSFKRKFKSVPSHVMFHCLDKQTGIWQSYSATPFSFKKLASTSIRQKGSIKLFELYFPTQKKKGIFRLFDSMATACAAVQLKHVAVTRVWFGYKVRADLKALTTILRTQKINYDANKTGVYDTLMLMTKEGY